MIRNVLEQIGGIGMYGLVAMLLFFAVFILVIVRTLRLSRSHVETMKHLPISDQNYTEDKGA